MKAIVYNKKLYKRLRKKGVNIINPNNTYISAEAEFEPIVTIYPGVQIIGKTKIGSFSFIGSNSIIRNSILARNVLIKEFSLIENSIIENSCEIGPYARLRTGTILKPRTKIGNFVEIEQA